MEKEKWVNLQKDGIKPSDNFPLLFGQTVFLFFSSYNQYDN